ncbi:porin family protein [uncultured Bacteroides sp.]|uniref:porin family protein n=1 Tax=uncultured Bacteroides sp. TaxID=162156 RepID=UPI0025E3446A|nr:porin family protein [uncultured Bacteroides sp.]
MANLLKKITVLGIVLTISIATFAQDVIIKKDAEEIQARIIRISETSVTYKKYTNQNGPEYVMAKKDIFMIKYEDGTKEVFTSEGGKDAAIENTSTRQLNRSGRKKASDDKKITYNFQVGMTVASLTEHEYGKSKVGWYIGGGMTVPLLSCLEGMGVLSLRPSLLFITKGDKIEIEQSGYKQKTTNNPVYLEIPVKIAFSLEIGKTKVVPYIGPYFAFGIGGKHKTEMSASIGAGTANGENDIEFFKEGFGKRFDVGMTIGAQYEFSDFSIGLGYDLGFSEVIEGGNSKNRALLINLGFKF